MKKAILGLVLLALLGAVSIVTMPTPSAKAASSATAVFVNTTATFVQATVKWQGWKYMSVITKFDNISTGEWQADVSHDNGLHYSNRITRNLTYQYSGGPSPLPKEPIITEFSPTNYDSTAVWTNVRFSYANRSKTMPRKKFSLWYVVE